MDWISRQRKESPAHYHNSLDAYIRGLGIENRKSTLTYLSSYLPTYLPIYLPTYLPTYLSDIGWGNSGLPTYLSTYLPTYLPQ